VERARVCVCVCVRERERERERERKREVCERPHSGARVRLLRGRALVLAGVRRARL